MIRHEKYVKLRRSLRMAKGTVVVKNKPKLRNQGYNREKRECNVCV